MAAAAPTLTLEDILALGVPQAKAAEVLKNKDILALLTSLVALVRATSCLGSPHLSPCWADSIE